MALRVALGIDPGTTDLGFAVVQYDPTVRAFDRSGGGRVLATTGVHLPRRPVPARFRVIARAVEEAVIDLLGSNVLRRADPVGVVVVENPGDFTRHPRARPRSPVSIAALGGAFAITAFAAESVVRGLGGDAAPPVVAVGTKEWLPRASGGRFLAHARVVEAYRALLGLRPAEVTEHEVMAAGLAHWYLTHGGTHVRATQED